MGIPANPTTLSVVADAMNQAIHTLNATSTSAVVIQNAPSFLENVKSQLWMASTTDKLLETTAIVVVSTGNSVATLPNDFDHETELRIFDGPQETNRGQLQAGGQASVQLATSFSADPIAVIGQWFFTLSGTGAQQEAQIATYSDTTKMATFSSALGTLTDPTTSYLMATQWWTLTKTDFAWGLQFNGKPTRYRMVATTTYVDPPPDQAYPIRFYYGSNLCLLDDAGFVFVNHLKQRRYYWLQGLKVEALGMFDDDRYDRELQKWQVVLANYAGKNPVYTISSFTR